MFLYRVTNGIEPGRGQYFECSACGHRYPDVEVFKTFFGYMPQFDESLQKTLQGVLTLFNECTPERFEENGELRFCPYCGAPFYHVVDVYEEWVRSYRLAGDESWRSGDEAEAALAPVERDCRERYRRWLEERMET